MSLPKIIPEAFNHKGCNCGHCFCSCNDCTGGRDWIKVGDYFSDRAIILPATAFEVAPKPITKMAIPDALAAQLTAEFGDEPSPEWFNPAYLEVLEALGYKVRPLLAPGRDGYGAPRTHGILHEGTVAGLLMPLDEPTESARKAA